MNVQQILLDLITFLGSFLAQLIQIVVSSIVILLSYLLSPLILLISAFVPNLSSVVTSVNSWITDIQTYLSYAINALAIPSTVLTLVSAWIVFRLSLSLYWWFFQTIIFRWFKSS